MARRSVGQSDVVFCERRLRGFRTEEILQLRALDPLIARNFGRTVFLGDCRDRLAEVRVPSLILQCTSDSIVPREVGRYLHRQLAGSTLREIEGAGHCPHLTHPASTIDRIREFIGARVA